MKTIRKKNKEKDDFKIPKSVQDTIPVNKVYKDGIFLIGKDKYRNEYNNMLLDKTINSNSMIQEKFLTITTVKKNIEESRNYFKRMAIELNNHFRDLGSKCEELDLNERLRLLHDFYRNGEESSFYFDLKDNMQKGSSFKDYICSDSMSFKDDYFEYGKLVGRVLFLKDYAIYINDDMV